MTRDRVPVIAALLAACAPSKRQASLALDRLIPLALADKRSANNGAVAGSPAAGAGDPRVLRHEA